MTFAVSALAPSRVHDATPMRLFDLSDVTYPLLAITLAARRDNLRNTLAVFEQRLATIKALPVEPVAAQRSSPGCTQT
jgi:hypothetical protein